MQSIKLVIPRQVVFTALFLLANAASAFEFELLSHWPWAPVTEVEWLSDSSCVAACGPTLLFYRLTANGSLEQEHTLELDYCTGDLEHLGTDLLVAHSSYFSPQRRGLSRIRIPQNSPPFVHHVNDLMDAPFGMNYASEIFSSPNNNWIVCMHNGSISLWNTDSDAQEVYTGYYPGGWGGIHYVHPVESQFYVSGSTEWSIAGFFNRRWLVVQLHLTNSPKYLWLACSEAFCAGRLFSTRHT